MQLVLLFLPLYDNAQQALPKSLFAEVRDELMAKFGGLTAHSRAPVDGLWQEDDSHPVRDDLIIYEVMTSELDRTWWKEYRKSLETRFRQEHLLIRAQTVEML
ncbi:MAG: hypothetical protein KKD27_00245 [Gammaproteobacteria bacterium]|jgi:hypothetical protein|uniref:hypothetical protein n=1 Tax=Stutzerimonas xanthomarina TaxID=271420 RepID=UPI000E965F97|nr:hypothetical protein [Stutzerimonas xanthomarina]MBU0812101.1 hypothetical protein [Gammaproteobacteria bacterium]HAW25459.1 hypothetical protein [Pseudomonas sp.]MBK3848761.1 hypothetical protein [Stutzerimonas xanthomarina]MBU0851691.1 hypothetical protein [Gammaproteobacteria bacterium]MBU1301698.1 hypothetical protein [Gammaproteobacteria bacterium]|tara:strand:+ start:954 stop:1262 length:309 start_codon:yes stop_codon:yes gene_type:complete